MIQYWNLVDLSEPDERDDAGGTCTLHVVRVRDISSMPVHIPGQVADNPLLVKDGTTSYTYKLDSDSISFEESTIDSTHGRYAGITLKGYRTGMDIGHQSEIDKLRPGYYILLWEHNSGWRRLLGTPSRPLKFSSTGDTGASDQDDVGHAWQFEGVQDGPSCYMSTIRPIPDVITTTCGLIDMDDFSLNPWQFDSNGDLVAISVSLDPMGDIASIVQYPLGYIYNAANNQVGIASYFTVSGNYLTIFPLTLSPGTYTFVIPNMTVTTSGTGATCSITFTQEYTVAGGAFSTAFSSAFDST